MANELDRFTPKSELPPEVALEANDEIPTDADVEQALKELGLTKIPANRVRALEKVGAHLRGHGVLRSQRGQAFATQQVVSSTMTMLHQRLAEGMNPDEGKAPIDTKDACALAHEISFAASKLTESQDMLLRMEGSIPRDTNPEKPIATAWPAGATVGPNGGGTAILAQTVHIHPQGPGEKSVAKENGAP